VQQLAAGQQQPAALTAFNLLPGKLAIEISPVEIEDFSLPKKIFIVLLVMAWKPWGPHCHSSTAAAVAA
jgi:hypothetical protein